MSVSADEAPPSFRAIDLPRVTGQHRNKALAALRRQRAIELKAQGRTYQQVADELGYANRGTVCRLVNQALATRVDQTAEEYLTYECDRLNALQASLWDRAMSGDVRAVQAVLRIIDARCRLLGLYPDTRAKRPEDGWPCCQGPATVVIREDDCRYQGCDKHGKLTDE